MNLFIIAYIGLILHWTGVFDSALKKDNFYLSIFVQKNWFKLFFDVVITGVLIYAKDYVKEYITVDILSAFFIGYLSGDIGHRFIKFFKGKFGTKLK